MMTANRIMSVFGLVLLVLTGFAGSIAAELVNKANAECQASALRSPSPQTPRLRATDARSRGISVCQFTGFSISVSGEGLPRRSGRIRTEL